MTDPNTTHTPYIIPKLHGLYAALAPLSVLYMRVIAGVAFMAAPVYAATTGSPTRTVKTRVRLVRPSAAGSTSTATVSPYRAEELQSSAVALT